MEKQKKILFTPFLKYSGAFAAGIAFGAAAALLVSVLYLRANLIEEKAVGIPFDEATAKFSANAAENPGWLVKKLQCGNPVTQKGARITVFETCSSKYAAMLAGASDSLRVFSLIPCKTAFYEKEGKTYMARLNAPLFYLILGGSASEIFAKRITPEQQEFIKGI